jgi:hypothetical protein
MVQIEQEPETRTDTDDVLRIKVLSLVIGTALSPRDILVQAVVSYF